MVRGDDVVVIRPARRGNHGEVWALPKGHPEMVAATIDKPLHQRVLDPACGSGTFLFHAVRHYLAAAQDEADGHAGKFEPVAQAVHQIAQV